jgi:CheY-like chemotaxis protein
MNLLQPLVGPGIAVSTDLSDEAGYVEAHRGQIEQVVMNLVANGRDAMPEGGRLHVATSGVVVEDRRAAVLGVHAGPYACLSVADTGVGMDERVRAHMFDPFFTTKASLGGSGLGLSTVYGIVRPTGGAIDVASAPGRGARLDVYLPRLDPPAAVEWGSLASLPRGHQTILVVDPQETFRSLLAKTLSELGYTVLEGHDLPDALDRVHDAASSIDLLFVDVAGSGRVSGAELAARVCAVRPATRVLFTSTADCPAAAGAAALIKPFTPYALARKLREVLGT